MDEPTPPEQSARAQFRAKLAAFAIEHPDLDTHTTAVQFGNTIVKETPTLVIDFVSSEAQNILAWELRAQFSRTRQGIFAALDFSNPDRPSVEALPDAKKETLYEQITQWREIVPSENRVRLLMTLNRSQLLESAQYDATRIARFGWKMLFKERIASGLPDEQTTVAQFYTPDQLATMGENIRKEMDHGNFRLKIKPVRPLSRPTSVQEQAHGRNPERPETDRGLAAG